MALEIFTVEILNGYINRRKQLPYFHGNNKNRRTQIIWYIALSVRGEVFAINFQFSSLIKVLICWAISGVTTVL